MKKIFLNFAIKEKQEDDTLRDVISSPPFVYNASHIILEKLFTNFAANALGTLVDLEFFAATITNFPEPASQHSISSVDLGLQHFAALRSLNRKIIVGFREPSNNHRR